MSKLPGVVMNRNEQCKLRYAKHYTACTKVIDKTLWSSFTYLQVHCLGPLLHYAFMISDAKSLFPLPMRKFFDCERSESNVDWED